MVCTARLTGFAFLLLAACGPTPPVTSAPNGSETARGATSARLATSASAVASASAEPAHGSGPATASTPIPMYPVQRIRSLFEVVASDGSIELRLGSDPGGGALGRFRYAPVVDGVPDLAHETNEIFHADTTSVGFIALAGKRPQLIFQQVSGFRSGAGESYRMLDATNRWRGLDTPSAPGLGYAITPWSKGRMLEWRSADSEEMMVRLRSGLPNLRVLIGADKQAPSVPEALAARLRADDYSIETFTALRSGEVVAVGRLATGNGFGTLVWKDNLREPSYVATPAALRDDGELAILGGETLAALRLRAGDEVMAWSGSAWVRESSVAQGGFPDVWFGTTALMKKDGVVAFARLAAGAPWRPVEVHDNDVEPSFAVDGAGTIWKTEGDLLLASKKPAKQLEDVTAEALVKARKASILRGGSDDTIPETFGASTCSMHYALLDEVAESAADTKDYPRIRNALRGHAEFGKARFIVSREGGRQFFGALIAEYDSAKKLTELVAKAVKGAPTEVLCAEPPVVRELKLNLATGAVIK